MLSVGWSVPSAAIMFTPKNPAFDQHGAEPVYRTQKVVVTYPPLVVLLRALSGNQRNSLVHSRRLLVAGALVAGGRSVTDRTPAAFHGTVTAVEAGGVGSSALLAVFADDVVLAAEADVLTAGARDAGAAHPPAVASSNAPVIATTLTRMMITSGSPPLQHFHP